MWVFFLSWHRLVFLHKPFNKTIYLSDVLRTSVRKLEHFESPLTHIYRTFIFNNPPCLYWQFKTSKHVISPSIPTYYLSKYPDVFGTLTFISRSAGNERHICFQWLLSWKIKWSIRSRLLQGICIRLRRRSGNNYQIFIGYLHKFVLSPNQYGLEFVEGDRSGVLAAIHLARGNNTGIVFVIAADAGGAAATPANNPTFCYIQAISLQRVHGIENSYAPEIKTLRVFFPIVKLYPLRRTCGLICTRDIKTATHICKYTAPQRDPVALAGIPRCTSSFTQNIPFYFRFTYSPVQ